MFQKIKNHLKDNHRGDMYIEMLICTTIMLLVSVIIISVASSVNTKLWLDEQLNDIVRQVENSGSTKTEAIAQIEKHITDKLGGYVTYYGTFIDDDPDKGLVQLNNTVYVYYHCDKYTAVSIAAFPIETQINIFKAATSNVYYKLEDTEIDDFKPEQNPNYTPQP